MKEFKTTDLNYAAFLCANGLLLIEVESNARRKCAFKLAPPNGKEINFSELADAWMQDEAPNVNAAKFIARRDMLLDIVKGAPTDA